MVSAGRTTSTCSVGDFNMSLFRVIPELRSRGAIIDSAAWYPWKDPAGIPCADSCGIFCLNIIGQHYRRVGRYQFDLVVQTGLNPNGYAFGVHRINCGPGKELDYYLSTKIDLEEKSSETFKPSAESTAVAAHK